MNREIVLFISDFKYDQYLELCNSIGKNLYGWCREMLDVAYMKELLRRKENERTEKE